MQCEFCAFPYRDAGGAPNAKRVYWIFKDVNGMTSLMNDPTKVFKYFVEMQMPIHPVTQGDMTRHFNEHEKLCSSCLQR